MKTGGLLVLIAVLAWMFMYFCLPNLDATHFLAVPGFLVIVGVIVAAWYATESDSAFSGPSIVGVLLAVLAFLYILVAGCGSSTLVNTKEYQTLLGEVDDKGVFSSDLAPVSTEQIRIVDEAVAGRVGDKILGEQVALGSQVDIGKFHIQQVQGRLYWVACLEHSNFLRWAANEGTAGYVMVSATNESDVRLITEIDGKPLNIKYQTAAFFGDDIARHIYMNGYSSTGYTDLTFEVDDSFHPYWVATLFKPTIWTGGHDSYGVVVVNAETGEIKEYAQDETPEWIDRMEPESFILDQIHWWGDLVEGWWNPSGKGKMQVTSATGEDGVKHSASLVYGEDGRCYWYVGLTSTGNDNGTIGFLLVDSRTKQAKFYHQSGASEEAAKGSAEGQVQEKGYHATFPITYNIAGVATYYMSLKDDAGLVKMMAFVSVVNFNTLGVGEDLNSALRKYRQALASQGDASNMGSKIERQVVQGKVVRFADEVSGGNSSFYLTLDKFPKIIFVAGSGISAELPMTEVGDEIKIEFDNTGNTPIDMSTFDNLEFDPQETRATLDRKDYFQEVRHEDVVKDDINNATHRFEDLSDSAKVELMKQHRK